MAAFPQILLMVLPLGVLLYLRERRIGPGWHRTVLVGLAAVWAYAAFEAVALLLFLFSPPGIGQDNWPELWVSLLVVVGLPAWLVLRSWAPRD